MLTAPVEYTDPGSLLSYANFSANRLKPLIRLNRYKLRVSYVKRITNQVIRNSNQTRTRFNDNFINCK